MNFNYKIKDNYLGIILLILTLIFFMSLVYCIFRYPYLSIDGAYTTGITLLPTFDLINVTAIDVHPPLYYLGLKATINLFSIINPNFNIVYVIEFFSVIPYVIIFVIAYTKIREDYGLVTAGVFSLTLISMSIFFGYYTMARMYSWAMLFALLAFIVSKDILEHSTYKSWILLSVFSILCAYTHYYAAIAVVILYLLLLIHIFNNRFEIDLKNELKKFITSVILAIILFIPWIFTLLNQISSVQEGYWISQIDMGLVLECLSNWLFDTNNFTIEMISVFVLILFVVYVAQEYLQSKKQEDYYVLFGTSIFIGTILLSAVISLIFKPILVLRYLLPVFSILWLCISIKVGKISDYKILTIIILIIIVISASNVFAQIESQEHSFVRFNDENSVYESINNNDSIILYDDLPRSIRTYYRLNDTYQQYGNYILGNELHSLEYKPFYLDNDSVFKIPQDYNKFVDKNVYIVTGHNLSNETNIKYIQLENVKNAPKIFKVNASRNEGDYANGPLISSETKKQSVDFEVIADSITSGETLNVIVKSNSDLERRINISVNNESELVGLKNGEAASEFTDLKPGLYQIMVSYNGDDNYKKTTTSTYVVVI